MLSLCFAMPCTDVSVSGSTLTQRLACILLFPCTQGFPEAEVRRWQVGTWAGGRWGW